MKVDTNIEHSWSAQFESHNILINKKRVWYPVEADKNKEIEITQGDDKDYISPDELVEIYQYSIHDLFDEKKDKDEEEKPPKRICGIMNEDPHARISVGGYSNRFYLYDDLSKSTNLMTIES